ncbi:MAG: hypothetical protein KGI91_02310 [Burkholderiales bacterium]|nr:hypothetical protein [Burkholderiales bacterium]MDE2431831.1 hypothetical protein [Burkholderiales bacterium]
MAINPLSWIAPAALDRLTLLLNHIVSSEPVAQGKLRPYAGRVIDIRWSKEASIKLPSYLGAALDSLMQLPPDIRFAVTPAGLFERLDTRDSPDVATGETATAHLTITVQLLPPMSMAARLMKGERPEVKIEGDAALAEVASWLMKNLRWDVEDDVARWMGTTPAQALASLTSGIKQALERWRPASRGDGSTR